MCYEEIWSSGKYKTWKDFLIDTAKLRKYINSKDAKDWILHCEDYWYFLVTFIALLQCKKRILLTQNISESFIQEIKTENIEFLTDQNVDDSTFIPTLIENAVLPTEEEFRCDIEINSDETEILMFTSGSTGKPKAVPQRMTEFELDNAFLISK